MSNGGKIPQGTLTIVGLATVVLAVLGLWYNYSTLLLDYSLPLQQSSKEHDVTDFYPIFYTMSVICVGFYMLLLASGAASGVSSGGLMYQIYVVFPIWGPLLALWARRRILATVAAPDL
jgi:hypothetical protein